MSSAAAFSVSKEAADLVLELIREAHLPAGAGLRIVIQPAHDSLSMSLARTAEKPESVVRGHGACVFLSRQAANRLHGKVLRAESTRHRSSFFLDR